MRENVMFAPATLASVRWFTRWRNHLSPLWAVGLALLALLLCLYVSRLPAFLSNQMNADNLLAVSLMWDLQRDDYAWQGFQLPRVPSIFPDLLIQAAASFASPSDGWAIFFYNYVQFILFVLAATVAVRLLIDISILQSSTITLAIISLIVLADVSLPGSTLLTFSYFLSCIHFGPFVASMFAAVIAAQMMVELRSASMILLFSISTLSVLSDQLILVSFTAPATVAALTTGYYFGRRTLKRGFILMAVFAASALTAQFFDKMLNRQPDVSIELAQALPRFKKFVDDLTTYIPEHGLVIIVCLVLPLTLFFAFPLMSFGQERRSNDLAQPESSITGMPWFLGFSRISSVFLWLQAALAMLAVVGATAFIAYADQGSYRYLVPAMSWSIVFAAALAWRVVGLRRGLYGASVSAALAIIVQLGGERDVRPGTVTWRLPLAECLQSEQERLNLGAGFAEYWSSRPIMVASGWSLQVNQATEDGRPYIWGNNPDWYMRRFDEPELRPYYNFIVMKKMDPHAITARFGQPARVHTCTGGEQIWIYADRQGMTDVFLNDFALPHLPPEGSYRNSCSNMNLIGWQLSAHCETGRGDTRRTTIDLSRCGGGVANTNGELTCSRR